MKPSDLEAIARGMVPGVRRTIAEALAPVLERNAALEARVLELETRPTPVVVGPLGPTGERGLPGVGIASLVISADDRLVAHLTDGRSVDAGPVPRGVPGSAGASGPAGPAGPPGPAGDRGPAGEKGLDGAAGAQGDRGPVGEKGLDGVAGPPGERGPVGEKGLDGAPGAQGDRGPVGDKGLDGRDAPPAEDVARLLLPLIPAPLEGPRGPSGPAGKDAQPVDVDALVERVAARVPLPKDGPAGPPGAAGEVGPRGPTGHTGSDGEDGVGLTGAVLDRSGHLVLTLSDGTVKDVGTVVGTDGVNGQHGKDVDPAAVAALVRSELATWPRPKDGIDGKDGLGFDDWDMKLDPARGVVLEMRQGDRVKDFICPQPFLFPKWKPGTAVPKGAGVQWDGGYWVALTAATSTPSENHDDWYLLSRRGKQGKEGRPGKDAPALRTSNTPPLYGG